jgi:hypothetical protein
MGDRHDIPEGKGKGPETPYDSTQAMLNDLARGQRDMMNVITQMAINTQLIYNSMGTMGANMASGASCSMGHHGGGASGSNGNPTRSSGHETPTQTYILAGKIPRLLFLQFQGEQQIGHPGQGQQMGQVGQGQQMG